MPHRPSNKAKPNTRFLGRIIKETTSHNAALLAREAAEAQARLNGLTETEEKKRRKFNPSAVDIRRRQLGDISSILQGRKRNKGTEQQDQSSGPDKDQPRERDGKHGLGDVKEEGRRSHRKTGDEATDERRRRRGRSSSPSHRDRRYRRRSPLSNPDDDERPRHSRSHREKSGKSHDLIDTKSSRRREYGRLGGDGDPTPKPSKHGSAAKDDESDPLEELIGPAPPSEAPVRPRGRGAIRGSAAVDSRFADDYDPASDAQPEPTGTDDWDEAVETYRDRQKWKQQGADRLREAGFTDEQIKKWEKGGEKDVDDVRWRKAGEKREWYVCARFPWTENGWLICWYRDRGKDDTEL